MAEKEQPGHNSSYPKEAVQWFGQVLSFDQRLWLAESEALRNCHLRLAAEHCGKINHTQHKIKL